MKFTLRSAKAEDEEFLFRLYANSRAEEMAAWGWDEAQQAAFLKQQFTIRESQYRNLYSDALHQIILIEDAPVGRMLTGATKEEVCLVDIAILSEYRRRGIGSELISDMKRQANTVGKSIVLSVTTENPARWLYARLGFVVTREDDLYLSMRWEP